MKHIEVVCAIIKKDDKYFCCQRSADKSLALKWEFPGGKIELNESKEEALIREIKEELKSNISIIEYIGVSNHVYSNLEKPFSISMYGFLCKLEKGTLELTEHIDSKFVSIDEMFEMDFAEADIPLIHMLKVRQN